VAVTTTSSRVTSFSCAGRQSGYRTKKAEEKIEIKRFIETSFSHQMGIKNFFTQNYVGFRAGPKPRWVQGWP
jgi:hypothetical protein